MFSLDKHKGVEGKMESLLTRFFQKYECLKSCETSIIQAFELLKSSYKQKGKLLICGNGGSASDSDHIVGELMKGFMHTRPLAEKQQEAWENRFGESGQYLAQHLQGALPAISLANQQALNTAFSNDVAADLIFAQQVYGYGNEQDVVLGISTSGNSRNVVYALQTAQLLGIRTITLTGKAGGEMCHYSDAAIKVPVESTPEIQELHLPIYHLLCKLLEKHFFPCSSDDERMRS